jgi:hypothetical protein
MYFASWNLIVAEDKKKSPGTRHSGHILERIKDVYVIFSNCQAARSRPVIWLVIYMHEKAFVTKKESQYQRGDPDAALGS